MFKLHFAETQGKILEIYIPKIKFIYPSQIS